MSRERLEEMNWIYEEPPLPEDLARPKADSAAPKPR